QSNASADHVRIAAHSFLPESLRDHGDIGAFFFLRRKIPAQNRMDAKNIEIVCGQSAAKNLDRIAEPGQSEGEEILTGDRFEQSLALAIVHISGRRDTDVDQFARFIAAEEMNHARGFLEREPAEEKIVDQTKDSRVQTNSESRSEEHTSELQSQSN